MDSVMQYREKFCNYINSLNDNETILLSFEDILYLFLSNNANDDQKNINILSNILSTLKDDKIKSDIKTLKDMINYLNNTGLDESLNKDIYNLLLVDQVIKKNNEVLKEEYDLNLDNMNKNLKNSYIIEKNNIIEEINKQKKDD